MQKSTSNVGLEDDEDQRLCTNKFAWPSRPLSKIEKMTVYIEPHANWVCRIDWGEVRKQGS